MQLKDDISFSHGHSFIVPAKGEEDKAKHNINVIVPKTEGSVSRDFHYGQASVIPIDDRNNTYTSVLFGFIEFPTFPILQVSARFFHKIPSCHSKVHNRGSEVS